MGNIAYKINLEHFDSYNPKHKFFMKDGIGVAIDVPLGSVSFAANRETLEYDQFTINFLHSTLESIYDEIEAEFTKELDHAPNYWEALKVYSTFNNYFSGIKPFYKGVEISGSKIHLKNNKEHNYHVYDDSSYRARSSNNIESGSLSLRETIYIDPTKDDLLFLNKHNFPQSTLRNRFFEYCRINGITRQTKSHMYIISATEDNVNDIINDPLLDGAKFIDLADVVIPVKARKARLSRVVDKSKIQVFKFNGNTSFPYSNCWDEAAINKSDKIVYITIDGFKPLNFQGVGIYNKYYNTSLPYFAERLETYNRVMGTDIVVYGIKKNVVPQPNWENFYELTTKALEELVKSGKITRHQKAIDFIDCAIDMRGFKDFEDSISKNGSFYKYYQLHKRYVDIATNHRDKLKQITRLLDVFNIQKPNMNSDHDIELLETKLYNAILKDYPLMDYLISNYKTWEAKPEEIVNYVKLIDNSRN